MEILIEKEYLYANSKGTDSTDYCRQQLKRRGRYLYAPEGRPNPEPGSLCMQGITAEGYKEILSITVGASESSKFWMGMLNDLKKRGMQNVLFFCADGLPDFREAIRAVFPQPQIQRCVIHMLHNSSTLSNI